MVKAMKRAMKATIGRADLNEEEFRTTVSKMAYLINSRPIQAVSDFHDYDVLTPNHFLQSDLAGAEFPTERLRRRQIEAVLKITLSNQRSTTCLEKISRRSYPTDGTKKK